MTGSIDFTQHIHVVEWPHNATETKKTLDYFVLHFCWCGHSFSSSVWVNHLHEVKLHPPSSIVRNNIHQAMICLIFVPEVGKFGGGIWLWGANLYCGFFIMRKQCSNILSYMWQLYRHDRTILDIQLGFHWQMTHVQSTFDVVHLHNIE